MKRYTIYIRYRYRKWTPSYQRTMKVVGSGPISKVP
uniref:Uncharacterized protein n=1 Tax=Anguilla anguilla TaxID=7936 RepID=A0A0E9Q716_ANGAN